MLVWRGNSIPWGTRIVWGHIAIVFKNISDRDHIFDPATNNSVC